MAEVFLHVSNGNVSRRQPRNLRFQAEGHCRSHRKSCNDPTSNPTMKAIVKHSLIGVGVISILLTAVGCKKESAPQQGPLPVNVVTVVEKEVNEWDEFT